MPAKKPQHQVRDAYLQKNYGITLNDFDQMIEKQGGVCPICEMTPTRSSHWAVHHDHLTGKIVAITCRECNVASGMLNDDPILLRRAARLISESRRRR